MEPFVPIPLLVSLICSALHNDMQIWQNMKVALSREIWSNALFSACWKCLSTGKKKLFSFASEEILIQPSLSVCLHLYPALLIHPVCTFFFCLNPSPSPTFSSAHPQGCMEVNTPEKLYGPELLSQSHLQTNSSCCTIPPCIIKSQLC